jgi:hypothetical protein
MDPTAPTPRRLAPAAFILGTGRSGTTLLRVMLAGHPRLWAPPETKLSLVDTMVEHAAYLEARYWEKGGLRRAWMDLFGVDVETARAAVDGLHDKTVPEVYALLQAALAGRMLVEKEPTLAAMPARLQQLESWFERPRYIWIVRHPGAVIRSFQNMPMAEVMTQGLPIDWGTAWEVTNRAIQDFLAQVEPSRWRRVRYEDLVTDPAGTMEGVCATLGVPFDPAVLDPYEGDRMRDGPKGARSTGDPNMAGRGRIIPELAEAWLDGFDPESVSPGTRLLAKQIGYDLDAMGKPAMHQASAAFGSLLDTLRALEGQTDLPMDVDSAEGRRFLLRMLAASVDTYIEHADVDRPRFHPAEGPTRKMFADCPDADYNRAPIRLGPGRAYVLTGRIPPGTLYVGVLLYGKGGRIARRLTDRDLACDERGRFEVRISTEPQPGVWLAADGDENAVMVRQYFGDRSREVPVELSIRLDPEPTTLAPPMDARSLTDGLHRAERMLKAVFERTAAVGPAARTSLLNRFAEMPAEGLFPTPDNRYAVCWYRFGPDQLMVVRGKLPVARYFGLSLCNVWLESLDYVAHPRSNLNHTQLAVDPDGRFEVVLAHSDPGHPNWMDVAGHTAGYLLARHLLLEGPLAELSVQVMYAHELRAHSATIRSSHT